MATSEQNPLSPFFLRLTHTGVHKDGSQNLFSVPLHDLHEGFQYQTRKQTIYVPVDGHVDLPVAPRVLLALSEGSIGLFIRDGLLSLDVVTRFRDIADCGGAGGAGVGLATTTPNIQRTGGSLAFAIDLGPDIEGFIAGENLTVSGLLGSYASLNGTYAIESVTIGQGLAGADPDLYRITVASPGADIAGAALIGVVLTLPNGKVNVNLSSGGSSGLGANVHSYFTGDTIVTGAVNASAFTAIRPDDGSGVDPNSFFWESVSNDPYWKDSAGALHPLLNIDSYAGEVQGSILYFNGVNWVQLPPGTSGETLTTAGVGANPSWTSRAATKRITAVESPYTVLATDHVLFVNGTVIIDLPVGVEGKSYKIADTGSGTVTINPNGGEQIYGFGAGVGATLLSGDVIDLHFNATDGWW